MASEPVASSVRDEPGRNLPESKTWFEQREDETYDAFMMRVLNDYRSVYARQIEELASFRRTVAISQTQRPVIVVKSRVTEPAVPAALARSTSVNISGRDSRRSKSFALLDTWALFLPQRVAKEDLGDYVEDINRRCVEGQRFRVWLGVLAAMFWTAVSAIGYFLEKTRRKAK